MAIQIELSPETEARLAAQAAARSMDVPTYAASLLEEAILPAVSASDSNKIHTPAARRQKEPGPAIR